jgi:tetratricopeptide (TPR) repeat protein
VLSDAVARAAYLKAHPEVLVGSQASPRTRTEVDNARDAERRARLARHPYLSHVMKVNRLVAEGKEAIKAGQYANAYASLRKVNAMRPDLGEVGELLEDTRKKHETTRAREELQAGNQARAAGKIDEAIRGYRMAHTLDPNLSTAVWRLSELLLEKKELDAALKFAEEAVKLEPERPDYHVTLGEILLAREGKESKKMAREHFETALRISPDHEGAKKGLKKTRWLF